MAAFERLLHCPPATSFALVFVALFLGCTGDDTTAIAPGTDAARTDAGAVDDSPARADASLDSVEDSSPASDVSIQDEDGASMLADASADEADAGKEEAAFQSDGPPGRRVCFVPCSGANDCSTPNTTCNLATGRCANCLDDMSCIATRSRWSFPCMSDGDCRPDVGLPLGDVCVDVDGHGFCAFVSTDTVNCAPDLTTPFTVNRFGGDTAVEVCGRPSRCDADRGVCANPCTSNTSCNPAAGGKVCNMGSGRCECSSDADCGGEEPTCNLTTQHCECGSTTDCAADTGSTRVCQ